MRKKILAATAVVATAIPFSAFAYEAPEGCGALNPGSDSCSFDAEREGAIGGFGSFRVTITRGTQTFVYERTNSAGVEFPGAIQPGDHVEAEALAPGSGVAVGNPTFTP